MKKIIATLLFMLTFHAFSMNKGATTSLSDCATICATLLPADQTAKQGGQRHIQARLNQYKSALLELMNTDEGDEQASQDIVATFYNYERFRLATEHPSCFAELNLDDADIRFAFNQHVWIDRFNRAIEKARKNPTQRQIIIRLENSIQLNSDSKSIAFWWFHLKKELLSELVQKKDEVKP